MWVETLDVRGFGRLRRAFEFSSGLTLVVGDNESGKSTLQEAIVRTLFGFSKNERRRSRDGVSEKDRFGPWSGLPYGINATVETAGGRRLRIEWDFAEYTVRLLDAVTGGDLSEDVRGRHDEVTLGRYLVGLELSEYRRVCCLDQKDADAVARSDDLVAALQQAVEQGGGPQGVDAAIERLNEFLRERLGVHATQLRPLPTGVLAGMIARRVELRAALAAARESRREAARLGTAIETREAALADAREALVAAEQARLSGEVRSLAAAQSALEEERTRLRTAPSPARSEALADFRRTRDSLVVVVDGAWPRRLRAALLVAAAIVAAASALAVRLAPPAGFAGLLAAAGLVAWGLGAGVMARRGAARALARFQAGSLAEIDDRVTDEDRRVAEIEAARALEERRLDDRLAEVRVQGVRARALLDAHLAAHGTRPPGPLGERAPKDGIREHELAVASLRARLEEHERASGDPAVIEEELSELETRMDRLENVRDAVVAARDALRAAASETHRRFAPHLNAALEQSLPRMTGGRYARAAVDEQLEVRVEAPETGRMVPADLLSRGTQDQIYLVERLEIARLLGSTAGIAPLLLDDPFAHYDSSRLVLVLSVLADVSRSRQIVLFSEDARLAGLVADLVPSASVITLPPPGNEGGWHTSP